MLAGAAWALARLLRDDEPWVALWVGRFGVGDFLGVGRMSSDLTAGAAIAAATATATAATTNTSSGINLHRFISGYRNMILSFDKFSSKLLSVCCLATRPCRSRQASFQEQRSRNPLCAPYLHPLMGPTILNLQALNP